MTVEFSQMSAICKDFLFIGAIIPNQHLKTQNFLPSLYPLHNQSPGITLLLASLANVSGFVIAVHCSVYLKFSYFFNSFTYLPESDRSCFVDALASVMHKRNKIKCTESTFIVS